MFYQLVAGMMTAVFIATVYYLLILFPFPMISLSSGYLLGLIVLLFGLYRMMVARTKGKKTDAKVIIIAGVLLILTTFLLNIFKINI
ncbi:hypothetical protein DCC39_07055 [Pueribacillus theae]|uniref:Uncharacterized protein n=1 Tax=Pueribacillus theae TaxID=2171751 RepID=A0A2U1K3U5_9BACI|nr:hypothetical protein [Pueribacillus theae]PWA12186.1 hypothetical protein DCC39_07055 [Pueribacillus theae]